MANTNDPFVEFKAAQREGWALFAPLATITTSTAAQLVNYAGITAGQTVLDVACGTGVVAVTAARAGAKVRGLDLSPVLLETARSNAQMARVEIDFVEGDAEALPYQDKSFDVVVSQFGHMFAPRPAVAVAEMLRVLKPGGRLAFSTWPPELLIGKIFALVGSYAPPPAGVAPPPQWGDPNTIRERLGDAVTDIHFDREVMTIPALSVEHYRTMFEATAAPVAKVISTLKNEPEKLTKFRGELDALMTPYFSNNIIRQGFLMTRALKKK